MYCATCDADKHPVQALKPERGIVSQCPTCESVFPETATQREPERAESAPLFAATAVPAKTVTVAPESDSDDIISRARARLAVVEGEIAKRLKYEGERDRLRRMLAAAGDDFVTVGISEGGTRPVPN